VVALIIAGVAAMAGQVTATPQSGPASFEVVGVRLGMAPDDVRQALTRAGYRVDPPTKLEGFKGEVAARIAEIRHQSRTANYDAIAGIDARGPSAERVAIEFRQWPDGPHVVRIAFMGNAQTQPQESFKAQVEARFGKPTMHVIGGWRWCSPSERQCGPVANPALPALDADDQSRALTLSIGTEATEARKALVDTEARKAVPLQGGSAF